MDNKTKSKIIYAKKGYFSESKDNNFLTLVNGKILNINDGKTNSFDFNETQINLSKYTSKTTKFPKIQEVNSKDLYKCLFNNDKTISVGKDNFQFVCENLRSYAKTDVTTTLSAKFRSRSTYYQLCTTLGAPEHFPNTSGCRAKKLYETK